MKVKFSKSVEFVPAFNGNRELPPEDQIKAELRVLSTSDLIVVMDALQGAGVKGQIDTENVRISDMKDVIAAIPSLLPKYVTISNLTDESGQPLSIEDVVQTAPFLPLQLELILELSVASTPTEDATKNSKAPPA